MQTWHWKTLCITASTVPFKKWYHKQQPLFQTAQWFITAPTWQYVCAHTAVWVCPDHGKSSPYQGGGGAQSQQAVPAHRRQPGAVRGQGQEAGPQRMALHFLRRLQLEHRWPRNTACILADKERPMGGEDLAAAVWRAPTVHHALVANGSSLGNPETRLWLKGTPFDSVFWFLTLSANYHLIFNHTLMLSVR